MQCSLRLTFTFSSLFFILRNWSNQLVFHELLLINEVIFKKKTFSVVLIHKFHTHPQFLRIINLGKNKISPIKIDEFEICLSNAPLN